MTEITE